MEQLHKNDTALFVMEGIEQPPITNPNLKTFLKRNKVKELSVSEYLQGICSGNRTILSKAITLVESSLPQHHALAQEIIEQCIPYCKQSIRIGITGVPGVGKSSFIETAGKYLTSKGRKLAVLAIDPSSERSGGSILGDKTRMEELSTDPNAFIRPSPSAGSLGGVARKTREIIILCEAAGFDTIFIETVGVGQSETAVHSMVDFFLLLMLAGAGDELQGIKRGIMEMADAIVITKADGTNIAKTNIAKAEYQNALHLFPANISGWKPCVLTCSAKEKNGISQIWDTIQNFVKKTKANGYFAQHRSEQALYWMYETINEEIKRNFYSNHYISTSLNTLEKKVIDEKISPFNAAKDLLSNYFKNIS